jgi:hypothetical protein
LALNSVEFRIEKFDGIPQNSVIFYGTSRIQYQILVIL